MSWKDDLKSDEAPHIAEVIELISIPSVSTSPEHKADTQKAAEWVAARLQKAGVPEVIIAPSDGHPAVIGRWHVSDDQPTILIYGHYDVQPAEPLELWHTPPFEPVRDGDVLFGRGSSDMKGNLLTVIQGVEASARAHGGKPPVNVSFIFEGEEEIGSPHLVQIIEANKDLLKADAVISADGGQYSADTPSQSVALKGLTGLQVNVTTASTDLHSGGYGAYIPNAIQALVQLAASFHNEDGHVLVKGFYDRVKELTAEDRAEFAQLPIDTEAQQKDLGVKGLFGESEYTPRERNWGRPTLDLNGIWGGFQGDGVKTVTPAQAHLKITTRLVPDQDPLEIRELIIKHIEKHLPAYASFDVVIGDGTAKPYVVDRSDPVFTAVSDTLRELYGKDPVITRSGGSVPATGIFLDELGLQTITLGWSQDGSRAHAPNEWLNLPDYLRGREGYALLLEKLAR